jgi:hypothetical protein
MARVHKVITSTHAIMANGALMAQAGTRLVALAAKHYSVPCICVSGLYKVAPTYPCVAVVALAWALLQLMLLPLFLLRLAVLLSDAMADVAVAAHLCR